MVAITTSELKDGMILGEDIDSGGEIIAKKGAAVDSVLKKKLELYHIIVVNVLTPEDQATTYYGKLKASKSFREFQSDYSDSLKIFRKAVTEFLYRHVPFDLEQLMKIVDFLVHEDIDGKTLFAYLYLNPCKEEDMTYAHCINIGISAKIFSRWLGLSAKEQRLMCLSGFLFDIGKFNLPSDILYKKGKLNKMEFDLVKTHPFLGYYMLTKYSPDIDQHILNATLQHHERADGSGYPQGLSGVQVDPYARAIAILDVYEAMTSAKPYRRPSSPYEAIRVFESTGYEHYDVLFVQTFLTHIVDELIGNRVRLNDGTEWEVIMNNKNDLSRPVLNNDGNVLDMAKNRSLSIVDII